MSPRLPPADGPLVAWYGDDFTGSAAVMEVLDFAGFPSVLFLAPPDADALARFPGRRGIGVAGDARTRDPAWMDAMLPGIFAALRSIGAPIVHYKACSTMDSAPHVGSIGRAAEIGLAALGGIAPLVLAAPAIRRWQAFGNLFAASPEGVARLDRHPTMRVHPVTPMTEADVRLHLARQTALPVGLVDLTALAAGDGLAATRRAAEAGARIVAYDVVDEATLAAVGETIWRLARESRIFAIGSQGLEYALVAAWRAAGHAAPAPRRAGPVDRVAIASGSCSPDTARQIAAAETSGFAAIAVDAAAAVDERAFAGELDRAGAAALAALAMGKSPLLHTARGPDDPAIARAREARARAGLSEAHANRALADGLGRTLAHVVETARLGRIAIAGGDTSSAGVHALGLLALTAEAALAPGAPLLRGHRADAPAIELALKGGQMGGDDFFVRIRDGFPPLPQGKDRT
ncbi:four-carbon acid sugar kinase family protein [Salinarimonas rosea]|uniref:four-carbon acid sugar kinase family protein n=1 Tax=Salinarimonas rosea TaxID=552063 RepID=UPI00040A555C|nr:four-carbon acid sugar kinase family protein [Salinarimonas rosea]